MPPERESRLQRQAANDPGAGADLIDLTAFIDGRPLGAFQIRLMLMIGVVVLMDGFDLQAMGFVAPALAAAWRISPDALGPIFGAALIGMLAGSILLSPLADRIGRRPVLVASTGFFGAAMLLTAAVQTIPELVALRFLTGFGVGGVMGNAIALASEFSPRRLRASLLMWISCGFTGGAILGAVLSAVLAPLAGWRSVFLAGGVLPILTAAAMFRLLPESLAFSLLRAGADARTLVWVRRMAPDAALGADVRFVRPANPADRSSITALFTHGRWLATGLLWLVSFCNLLDLFFLSNWLPLLTVRAGYAHSTAVLIGATLQAGGLMGAAFLGPLIDRAGFFRVLLTAFLVAIPAIAAVGQAAAPLPFVMAVVLASGVCILGAQPGVNALAASLYPTEARATGVGWCLGIGRAGSILGPFVAAWFIRLHVSNAQLFMAAAAPALVAAFATFALWRVVERGRLVA